MLFLSIFRSSVQLNDAQVVNSNNTSIKKVVTSSKKLVLPLLLVLFLLPVALVD